MSLLIFHANISLTLLTHICSSTTLLFMISVDFDFEFLLTISACLRLHFTMLFMLTENDFGSRECTVLASDRFVSFCIVLLFISLGNYFSAFPALIVRPGTTDLVHAVFACLNLPLASRALLSFNCFDHYFQYNSWFY